jgi:hypothetical protein
MHSCLSSAGHVKDRDISETRNLDESSAEEGIDEGSWKEEASMLISILLILCVCIVFSWVFLDNLLENFPLLG